MAAFIVRAFFINNTILPEVFPNYDVCVCVLEREMIPSHQLSSPSCSEKVKNLKHTLNDIMQTFLVCVCVCVCVFGGGGVWFVPCCVAASVRH